MLSWSTMKIIYTSFIVKIFTIFGFISFFLSIPLLNEYTNISIICLILGILLFITSYFIYIIFIPSLINKFNELEYEEYIIKKSKDDILSETTEFSFLCNVEQKDLNSLAIYNNKINNIHKFNTLEEFKSFPDYLYQLSKIKYCYTNYFINNIYRKVISIMLYISVFLIYINPIIKIMKYIFEGIFNG